MKTSSFRFHRVSSAFAFLALLCLVLAGCGLSAAQEASIEKFSTATATLGDLSAQHLVQVRQDVVAIRQQMYEMGSDEIDLTDPANDLDGALSVGELQRRLRATAALKEFGQLLQALTTTDSTARLETAGTSFLTNLRKIEGVRLSDEQAAALGKLIVSGGRMLLDAERAKRVKEVVIETRTPVKRLVTLLRQDLDPNALLWAAVLVEARDSVEKGIPQLLNDLKPGGKLRDKALTEADIALLWSRYQALRADTAQRCASSEMSRSGLLAALDEMEKAHETLCYVVQTDQIQFPEINDYLDQVEELTRLFQAIRGK
jgi:hypothetical protein